MTATVPYLLTEHRTHCDSLHGHQIHHKINICNLLSVQLHIIHFWIVNPDSLDWPVVIECTILKLIVQWTAVLWDSDSWMGQLPKPLYNCQNVTQMNVLLHVSPRPTSCEFHYILTTLRWFWKLSHSAVAVPHHCRPLYPQHGDYHLAVSASSYRWW